MHACYLKITNTLVVYIYTKLAHSVTEPPNYFAAAATVAAAAAAAVAAAAAAVAAAAAASVAASVSAAAVETGAGGAGDAKGLGSGIGIGITGTILTPNGETGAKMGGGATIGGATTMVLLE